MDKKFRLGSGTNAESTLHVTLLGAFSLVIDNRPNPSKVCSRSDSLSLFKFLLLRRGESLGRTDIVRALWPETSMDTARHRLSNALSALKKDFDLLVRPGIIGDLLMSTNETICCKITAEVRTDVDEFEEDLDLVSMSNDPAEQFALLNNAITRYRGELLSDTPIASWFSSERELLQYRFTEALRSAAALAKTLGNCTQHLSYLVQLVEALPEDEAAARELMSKHSALGKTRDVEAVFEHLRRNMASRSGTRPSNETFDAYQRCKLSNDSTVQHAPVQYTRSPSLERPATTLFGVDHVVQSIISAVLTRAVRAIVLIGPTGVGKASAMRAALWRLTIQRGIEIEENIDKRETTQSEPLSDWQRSVSIHYDVADAQSVYELTRDKRTTALITTNVANLEFSDESQHLIIHVNELCHADRHALFTNLTLGLSAKDELIHGASPGGESLLSRCLRQVGGMPATIATLATHYLDRGPSSLVELSALFDCTEWPNLPLVQGVYQQKQQIIKQIDPIDFFVIDLLGNNHLWLPLRIIADQLQLDELTVQEALNRCWSNGLVQVTEEDGYEANYAATFEANCVAHIERSKKSVSATLTNSEVTSLHKAFSQEAYREGHRAEAIRLLSLNSAVLIGRIKRSALTLAAHDIRWITSLRDWFALIPPEQHHPLQRLRLAVDAALALASLNDDALPSWPRYDERSVHSFNSAAINIEHRSVAQPEKLRNVNRQSASAA
jgi:DNA-binding SARP family transcriptional activator